MEPVPSRKSAVSASKTHKLVFHGILAKEFTAELDAFISTPYDALRLVEANRPGILRRRMAAGEYIMYVPGTGAVDQTTMQSSFQGELHFVPVAVGGIAVSTVIAIISVVLAVASIAFALSQAPNEDSAADAVRFQPEVNVIKEGAMVPVVYGQTRVGSVVISSERALGQSVESFGSYNGPLISDFVLNTSLPLGGGAEETLMTRVLHAVSEGPIEGLVEGAKSILLNDVQLVADDNVSNFDRVRFEEALGTDPNTLISLVEGSATERNPPVATDLSTTRTVVTVPVGVDAVRILVKVNQFFRQRSEDNAKDPLSVELHLEKRPDGGSYETVSRPIIQGAYEDEKFFQFTIELDESVSHDIALSRVTEEISTGKIFDVIFFENIIEIQREKVRYDGTAVIGLEYDNESFGGRNPETEFIIKGRTVQVPNNYNPDTRTYSGVWDGGYVQAYTNNIAFCIQDVIENTDFGLGEHVQDRFNRFQLYSLGQYADEEVDDGLGGLEPRFTLNTKLVDRKKAMVVLRDLASTLRAQAIWDGSQVGLFVDDPKTVSRVITQANVIDGDFTYSRPSRQARINAVQVSFLDATNNYIKSYARFQLDDQVNEFGLNEKEYESLSTSRGQAYRYARFAVLSADSDIVRFEMVEDGAQTLPGELIAVWDPVRMGRRQSGRLTAATTTTLTMDAEFTIESGKTYSVRVTLPDGTTEERSVSNAPGDYTVLTLASALSAIPIVNAVFGITASDLEPSLWVVLERDNKGDGRYLFTAVEYVADRYNQIDTGVVGEDNRNLTLPNQRSVAPPRNVTFQVQGFYGANGYTANLQITWEPPPGRDDIIAYDVTYRRDFGPETSLASAGRGTNALLTNAQVGEYQFYIRARTAIAASAARVASYTLDKEALTGDPDVTLGQISGLELYGQGNDTVFQNKDAKFTWRYLSTVQNEDFGSEEFGADSNAQDPYFKDFIIEIVLADGTLVRRQEGILSNEYIYSLERNVEDGGPYRSFTIKVYFRNIFNDISPPSMITVSNPAPPLPEDLTVDSTIGAIIISYKRPTVLDWAGTLVHVRDMQGFSPSPANLVADTADTTITISAIPGETLWLRLAAYDTYSQDELNYSSEFSLTIPSAEISTKEFIFSGFQFSTDPATNQVIWTAGLSHVNDQGVITSYNVVSGNAMWSSGTVYISWTEGETILRSTDNISNAVGQNTRILASYKGGVDLVVNDGGVLVHGDQLIAGTIGAAQIAVGVAVITEAAQIANAIVGNAQIGNVIQSAGWNSSTKAGWQIDKNGVIRGTGIEIYDGGGNLIFSSGSSFGDLAALDAVNLASQVTGQLQSGNAASTLRNSSVSITQDGRLLNAGSGQVLVAQLSDSGAFALLDAINSSNISTYIASAAIGSAYISDLVANKITAGSIIAALSLTSGSINVTSSGKVYSGKTNYNTAASGFFLGIDGGVPKFRVGNADNSRSLSWDGATARVNGALIIGGQIDLVDITAAIVSSNSSATTTFSIRVNRQLYQTSNVGNNPNGEFHQWLRNSTDTDAYDVGIFGSGDASSGLSVNTWYQVSVDRTWSWTKPSSPDGAVGFVGELRIRDRDTGETIATSEFSSSATVITV